MNKAIRVQLNKLNIKSCFSVLIVLSALRTNDTQNTLLLHFYYKVAENFQAKKTKVGFIQVKNRIGIGGKSISKEYCE